MDATLLCTSPRSSWKPGAHTSQLGGRGTLMFSPCLRLPLRLPQGLPAIFPRGAPGGPIKAKPRTLPWVVSGRVLAPLAQS